VPSDAQDADGVDQPECVYIDCGKCGASNHYDAAHNTTDPGPGRCHNCSAFLRQPTEAEHEQFTEFLKFNAEVGEYAD